MKPPIRKEGFITQVSRGEGAPGGGSYNREITACQSIQADLKAARSKMT